MSWESKSDILRCSLCQGNRICLWRKYPLLRFSWMQPENQYCRYPKLLSKNSNFNQSPWDAALEHFSTDSTYLPLQDKHENHSNWMMKWLGNAMVLLVCVVKEPSHQRPGILDYTALKTSKLITSQKTHCFPQTKTKLLMLFKWHHRCAQFSRFIYSFFLSYTTQTSKHQGA